MFFSTMVESVHKFRPVKEHVPKFTTLKAAVKSAKSCPIFEQFLLTALRFLFEWKSCFKLKQFKELLKRNNFIPFTDLAFIRKISRGKQVPFQVSILFQTYTVASVKSTQIRTAGPVHQVLVQPVDMFIILTLIPDIAGIKNAER